MFIMIIDIYNGDDVMMMMCCYFVNIDEWWSQHWYFVEQNDEGSPEDFEFVDDSAPPTGAAGEAAPEEVVDPLEVAIAQMRAMGFEDDSGTGWLSQLIKAKNYDIGKVLDAIHYDGKNWASACRDVSWLPLLKLLKFYCIVFSVMVSGLKL